MTSIPRGGEDMGSQVDIYSHTDACIHSNQGVWPEVGWLGQTHNATQRHPCFHQLCIGGRADMDSQVDINSCTDACTHSNQGVWPDAGRLGHTHSDTQGHPGFCVNILRGWANMGSQMVINTCPDAYTHSKQGVGTQAGWPGTHTQCQTWAPSFPCNSKWSW